MKTRHFLVVLGCFVFVAGVSPKPAVASYGPWVVDVIDEGMRFSTSSMGYDGLGRPAVAFGDDALYYAVYDGAAWQIETVESTWPHDGTTHPSLAFDAMGFPAISYVMAEPVTHATTVRFARWDGSRWAVETIDDRQPSVSESALAFDGEGHPAVCYRTPYEFLKLARWDGVGWSIEVITDAVGGPWPCPVPLAFDADGHPMVAYAYGSTLRFARYDGAAWQFLDVDQPVDDTSISMTVDGQGDPALSYAKHAETPRTSYDLMYAEWVVDSFAIETVDGADSPDDVGEYTSLAFDSAGRPAIAYHDQHNHDLKFARWDGTAWGIETLDGAVPSSWSGLYPSLAFHGDVPSISCFRRSKDRLIQVTDPGTGWETRTIAVPFVRTSYGPRANSLAFDPLDRPTVSYHDARTDDLKFAVWTGDQWDIETVDEEGNVGYGNSLVYDGSGHPIISYWDATNDVFKIARNEGTGWGTETVDPTQGAGGGSSLALDPSGMPAVSFVNDVDNSLMLARWDGSFWNSETVDVLEEIGGPTSLAFDLQGNPVIAYTEVTIEDRYPYPRQDYLKVARYDGQWSTERFWPVEASPYPSSDWIWDVSLVIAGDGNPFVFSSIETDEGLSFISALLHNGVGWVQRGVPVPGLVQGRYCSAGVGQNGQPAVAYFDSYFVNVDGDLMLSTWTGERFENESAAALGPGDMSSSLAFDSQGKPAISFYTRSFADLRIAYPLSDVTVYRSVVGDLSPGWKGVFLPLTADNDLELDPFPAPAAFPGMVTDPLAAEEPLVLYRVLGPEGMEAGNCLRVSKGVGGIDIYF